MPSPAPVANATLADNVNWQIQLIGVQIAHAKKVKGRARSGYYKIATLLGASVAEGITHALLVKKLGTDGVINTGKMIAYDCHQLPKNFNESHTLAICKQKQEILLLKKNPDFAVLNNACLKEEIFSKRDYNNVDKVRSQRNKIHLQGLNHFDRSYTSKDVERVSAVINRLLSLYNES